jgi:hypothetical protein
LKKVWSTSSCVAVSCLPDADGPTEVTIGTQPQVDRNDVLIFDNWLQTPSRRLQVETVLAETLFSGSVSQPSTRVRIWTNGRQDTDRVIVGFE